MTQCKIVITEPTGASRVIPLDIKAQGITIGRGSTNHIVLDYSRASREHVRVTFDGQRFYATDLGSSNGTVVGRQKLIPNMARPWSSNEVMMIGDMQMRLEVPQVAVQHIYEQQRDHMHTIVESGASVEEKPNMAILLGVVGVGLCGIATVGGAVGYWLFGG